MSDQWQVKAVELFGAPGEEESTDLGVFESKEQALQAAKESIRESLDSLAPDAISVADLMSRFNSFGETTVIYNLDTFESATFSGVDYAKSIARSVFQDRHATDIDPVLRAAYRATHYVAALPSGEVLIEVGQKAPTVSAWLAGLGLHSAIFLSAWNPMSKPLSSKVNAIRHADLLSMVRNGPFPFVEAVGQSPDGSWSETSLLIAGVPLSEANRWARVFEQAGYVWIDRDESASLRIRTRQNTWVDEADLN
ncbi:hypothetical protein GCM10028794_24190 [Silanimonas algicola]